MVEGTSSERYTIEFPMLQPPSPLLEMASLRLPDSEEFDVEPRRRSNNGNVAATAAVSAVPPSATATLLQMRNEVGDYLSSVLAEALATTSPRTPMEEHGLLLNKSLANVTAGEQMPDRLYRHSVAMSAVYCVAYVLVFVVGLIGNSFVIAVVYRSPRMRTVTNFFIVNLAVADVLVIVFCLPATLLSNIFVREYPRKESPDPSLFLLNLQPRLKLSNHDNFLVYKGISKFQTTSPNVQSISSVQ